MAIEHNIPNEINIPGPLIGRHESSDIAPMGFAAFTTRMKSDIAPMSTLSFTTRMKSDVFPIPFANFTTAMKSDIAPITLRPPEMKSLFEIQINPLSGRHESSNVAPINSILGANNTSSAVAPINSTLGANNESSNIAPITSTLTGRFESSDIAPIISQIQGRHESSAIDSSPTTPTGRHESSAIDSSPTTPTGRHESSAIDDSPTTPDGRFTSSDIDDSPTTPDGRFTSSDIDDTPTTPDGRHESSTIDTTAGVNFVNIPDTDSIGFTVNNSLLTSQFQGISGADYTYPDSLGAGFGILGTPPALDGRHESSTIDTTAGVDFLANLYATGFTVNQPFPAGDFTSAGKQYSPYPGSPAPIALSGRNDGSDFDPEPGVNFVDIPNKDAQGFTIGFDTGIPSQFQGVSAGTYTYPDSHGLGLGLISNSLFTNTYPTPYTTLIFPDGFVENQPIEESQYSKDSFAEGGPLGLGTEFTHATFGGVQGQVPVMGNNPTGLGSFLQGGATSGDMGIVDAFDDLAGGTQGFTIYDPSLGSERFTDGAAGGAIIGASLNAEYKHHTPVPGFTYGNFTPANTGTGLAASITEDTTAGVGSGEAGKTFGAIGVIDAFDDTTSGAKGFTAKMFDLGLPKTQFNGVAGTPGALTYEYPTDVGPDGTGRLMYNMPFSDAGNPYGGEYTSELAKQIPINPLITINKDAGTDPVEFDFYKADPDRLHFNEDNKYRDSLLNFDATAQLNGMHPQSILADFAAREHSPSPLDSMEVLIPANTGPTGEAEDTAVYTHVEGYPNYQTHNLSYGDAEVANQRAGFVRNELFSRTIDYNNSELYGHNLKFGGHGDDPNGIKIYKEPHILRDMDSNWGFGIGFDEGAFRGGFLTLTNRALQDVVRNVKHIIEDPIKGILWGLKQVGLQASNPKVETEMIFLGRRTRTFNLGVGMIANMLTGPFGIKLYRHGLLNGIGEGDATYERAVKVHGGINPYDPTQAEFGKSTVGKGGANRLASLKWELLYYGGEDIMKAAATAAGVAHGYKGEEIDLLSDDGFFGPKSLYGIGGTTIRRWEKTDSHMTGDTIEENIPDTVGGGRSSLLAKYAAASHFTLYNESEKMHYGETSFNDFRQSIKDNSDTVNGVANSSFLGDTETTPYEEFNREVKFGYNPHTTTRDLSIYNGGGGNPNVDGTSNLDKWNADHENFEEDYGSGEVDEDENGMRDMIKCIVEDIHTGKKVRFRSYISDVVDTISPSWNSTNYVGRPDSVHSYQNTSRNLTFTLMMAAQSRQGMVGMYKRLNYLYGLCYPHLGSGEPEDAVKEAMLAPYVKLTIGDWLYKCPGFFSEVTTTIDNNFPWEINLEKEIEVGQLPHMVSLGLGFTVIGDGPHLSAVKSKNPSAIAGRHIGGGVNDIDAAGKFFENTVIAAPSE